MKKKAAPKKKKVALFDLIRSCKFADRESIYFYLYVCPDVMWMLYAVGELHQPDCARAASRAEGSPPKQKKDVHLLNMYDSAQVRHLQKITSCLPEYLGGLVCRWGVQATLTTRLCVCGFCVSRPEEGR